MITIRCWHTDTILQNFLIGLWIRACGLFTWICLDPLTPWPAPSSLDAWFSQTLPESHYYSNLNAFATSKAHVQARKPQDWDVMKTEVLSEMTFFKGPYERIDGTNRTLSSCSSCTWGQHLRHHTGREQVLLGIKLSIICSCSSLSSELCEINFFCLYVTQSQGCFLRCRVNWASHVQETLPELLRSLWLH